MENRKLLNISKERFSLFQRLYTSRFCNEFEEADRYLIETDEENIYINGKKYTYEDWVTKEMKANIFNEMVDNFKYFSDDIYIKIGNNYEKVSNEYNIVKESAYLAYYKKFLEVLDKNKK